MTTAERIKARAALIDAEFLPRVKAALWEAVEACPSELLVSDHGTRYTDQSFRGETLLDHMVDSAVKAAAKSLKDWL